MKNFLFFCSLLVIFGFLLIFISHSFFNASRSKKLHPKTMYEIFFSINASNNKDDTYIVGIKLFIIGLLLIVIGMFFGIWFQ